MKTKILLFGFCISFGLSNANAEFEPVNLGDPTDKFLMYMDFSQAETVPHVTTYQVKVPMKSDAIDKELHQEAEDSFKIKFSKVWMTGNYIIDCDNRTITRLNLQTWAQNAKYNFIHLLGREDTPSTRKLDFADKTDILIYQKICKPNPMLTK